MATAAAILVLSLLIGTAVTWRYAQETRRQAQVADQAATNKYRDYIIKHFPLLDRAAKRTGGKSHRDASEASAAPTVVGEARQIYDQVVRMFQEASELPPTDKESRIVIARALSRLASTRSNVWSSDGNRGSPRTPSSWRRPESDFVRSIALFEKLLVEQAGDPVIRRYLADAVGLGGMGCHMKFTHRPDGSRAFVSVERSSSGAIWSGVACAGDVDRRPSASRRSWRKREPLTLGIHR